MQSISHLLRCSGLDTYKTNIVKADGCLLEDETGKRYLDFEAAVWCIPLGYNHPDLNATVKEHLDTKQAPLLGFRYENHHMEKAAVTILETLNFSNESKCVFLSSCSEAVEFWVQITRKISNKHLLLALKDNYFSAYGSAGKLDPSEWHILDWSRYKDEREDYSFLQHIPLDSIGGVIFDSGNSSGLIKFPPKWLISHLSTIIKKQGGIIVADEVTTGLGRTGKWYGFQHYSIQPDIVVLGKGLGNGWPVSAIAMNDNISQALGESIRNANWHYGQSHQNNPMACLIASKIIEIIKKEDLVAKSQAVGNYFLAKLNKLKNKYNHIKEVRDRGLMIAVEFTEVPVIKLFEQLLGLGFIVGCKPAFNTLRFYPPLTITQEQVLSLVNSLDLVIRSNL